jgi:KDO2-lipid IV(A) lauroyltransferase
MALKYNVPVIMAFDVRDKKGNHKIFFNEGMEFYGEYNEENIFNATKTINSVIEKYILEYPHLWLWLHRKWRLKR